MVEKRIRSDLHVAVKSGFVSGIGRVDIGDVAVDGHPVLKRAAAYFRPLVPRFVPPDVELEPPTAPTVPTGASAPTAPAPPTAPAAPASTVPPRSGA